MARSGLQPSTMFQDPAYMKKIMKCRLAYICRRSSGTFSLIFRKVFLVAGLLGLTGRNLSRVTISLIVASQAAYSIT